MTVLENAEAIVPKLPIWQTTKVAYRDTFGNLRVVATAAALPFGLSMLLDAIVPNESANIGLYLVFTVASTVIVAFFELSWLRFLLLGKTHGKPGILPGSMRRVLAFQGYSLALLALFVLPMLLSQIMAHRAAETPVGLIITMVALYLPATYLWARPGFASPWDAVDAEERFAASRPMTASNGIRLLIALDFVGLPVLRASGAVLFGAVVMNDARSQPTGAFLQPGSNFWILHGVGNLLLYLYYALSCAVLAQAFCTLTGWQRDRRELLERFE